MAGSRLFICAAAMIALVCPAWAQVATSSGSRVVLDPETWQTRVINPTLDGRSGPEEPAYQPMTNQEPIILRKPRPHKPKPKLAEAPPPVETPPAETETPQAEAPAAEAPPAEQPQASAPPSAPGALSADDYDSGFGGAAPQPAPAPKPVPKKVVAEKPKAPPPPKPAPAAKPQSEIPFSLSGHDNYGPPPKPQQQAVAEPQPTPAKSKSGIGEVRNVHINFTPGAAEPTADVATALQSLAPDITNELQAKAGRLLLQAFAGTPGDKSSEARRLSLKRALAVRQLLIDSGVPSDRIDVRAMGGATDAGKPDRVDVMLHG
ncbi:MAG TPA: OmpA family protein [Rhizomicrobium sp.]